MTKLGSPIEIIKKSTAIFFKKNNMVNFVKIYLPLLPFSLISIWRFNSVMGEDQINNPKFVGLVLFINLAYIVIYLWIYISGVLGIKKIINNEKLEIRQIYKKAWKMVWKFSLLSALLTLIMLFGGVLLVFPAIILGIWYGFSKFIYIDEELGILRSLVRSKNLTQGNFWPILGRFVIFMFFTGLIGVLSSILPFGIGGVVTTLLGALFVLPYYLLYLELKKGSLVAP